jgi:hypothetical protein
MSYKEELNERIKGSEQRGKLYDQLTLACVAIGFLASAFSTVSVFHSWFTPDINAAIVALPAIAAAALKTFRFDQTSKVVVGKVVHSEDL